VVDLEGAVAVNEREVESLAGDVDTPDPSGIG
jgi:hypothetical protein